MGAPLVEGVDFGVIVQAEVDSVARAETAVKSESDFACGFFRILIFRSEKISKIPFSPFE